MRSIAWERAHIDRKALEIWKNLDPVRWGRNSHFLQDHSNWKNQGGVHMKAYGTDVRIYAQFTRSISGHAPIGQYRARFFPEEPRHCPECGAFQDRYHVMFECESRISTPALTPTPRKMRIINRITDRNLKFAKHIELSPLKPGKRKTPQHLLTSYHYLPIWEDKHSKTNIKTTKMKPTGDRKIVTIGVDQPDVEGSEGAAKAAMYAIGQGKPGLSKAGKAKEIDTAAEGERDITPTQHHARKAGDLQASILAKEEEIFERVANWTPPNNDHLTYWDPLSGSRGDIDVDTFLGCEFKAAAYTRRYDIRGWILYRTHKYPNTDVYIYLLVDIPLEEMQVSYFLACCGLQIFPDELRDYQVPACIRKFLTNAGSDTNPHWILAGDTNPFIPVHRVGVTDDDAAGDIYASPEPATSVAEHKMKQEEAEGLTRLHNDANVRSGGPAAEANIAQATGDWGVSPATIYRTPSMSAIPTQFKGKERERSMSPHRYLSPTPAPTGPTPPGNQLAVYPQVNIPFTNPVIPQGETSRGAVQGRPEQVDSLGNRYSFGVTQTPEIPDSNWHVFAISNERNITLKGQNITETLRKGVNEKKHIPTPYEKGDNVYIKSWDDIKVISKTEYLRAGGKTGHFYSKTYDSDSIPEVPQAVFVEERDRKSWAEWSVEAARNISFINDFGRYDMIARGEADPSQFEKISIFTTEQRCDLVSILIQLITSLPTEATNEKD
ncbi:hypothetical protein AX16_003945 [Volvariella volvacea WC 439]|nr:hypothetical protein AX16_003945 [Volvariella volvacea WC 439]